MLKLLELHHVGPAADLAFQLSPRLNVLTGDNGLGKTFVLDVAWWALTRTWVSSPAWVSPDDAGEPRIRFELNGEGEQLSFDSLYRFEAQDWSEPEDVSSVRSLVIYGRADGGFSVWDAVRNSDEKPLRVRNPPAFHFTPQELWDGKSESNRVLCNGLVRDWVSWQRAGEEAFTALSTAIRKLSPSSTEELVPGPPSRVRVEDARDIPTLRMPYGLVPLTHAAAGLRRTVSLAYVLVWAWFEHVQTARLLKKQPASEVVLLVDELEAHLHPQWQRAILPALLDVVGSVTQVEPLGIQIMAATHSPLVLASVEALFDEEKDSVILFELSDQTVNAQNVAWAKQGDVVGWLTSEIFGLKQARSREAERAIEAAEAWMRLDRTGLPAGLDREQDIHQELLRLLPGHDPFWPRWIVYREDSAA